MKKIIIHSFAIIIYFSISACGNSTSFPSITPVPSATYTPTPSVTPSSPPTSSTPEVPALVKTSLEFYRNGKVYEVIVGYSIGNAFHYATPRPPYPFEKQEKAGAGILAEASSAELERYGDFDGDGEMEFIVSLMYCEAAYCTEIIQIYEYDIEKDTYYVADKFRATYPAVDEYTDLNNDGTLEIITANYGFCYACGGAAEALATFLILRYENGKFVDVSSEFPELIQKEANKLLVSAKANEQHASFMLLPAYLYNMHRLGKMDEARQIFDQICKTVIMPSMSTPNSKFDCGQYRIDVEKFIQDFESKT
jgi:hypothetical protein